MSAANRRPRGQSSVEYLVVCVALALVLGLGMRDGSVLRELVDAFGEAFANFSFALSLPE